MHFSSLLYIATVVLPTAVSAKSVFAHIVMGNTVSHDTPAWTKDISLAKAAGIDAFVLNMGHGDPNIPNQVANAFKAAEAAGSSFKLFFAFDYLGGDGVWPASDVISTLNQYKGSAAYFKVNSQPLVSTFEGGNNANDWAPGGAIRTGAGEVWFIPNWDGTGLAVAQKAGNAIQGFFSWKMWPTGATNMTTANDNYWKSNLPGKQYMMGVSPWFAHTTNSGGAKWGWRGDDLWADRWAETLQVQPDFVQIATWNDYGESSYIGPPPASQQEIPSNSAQYVNGYAHDSWRDFLPYYIATYKGDTFTISRDQLQYWYRTSSGSSATTDPNNACFLNGNANYEPIADIRQVMEDGIFFSALLKVDSAVTVQIGTGPKITKAGKAGINHWSVPFNGQTGVPVFTVVSSGLTGKGAAITSGSTLASGCVNWNAWVGSA